MKNLVSSVIVQASETLRETESIRWGQSLYNALHSIAPPLAFLVQGTSLDPFFDDSKVPEFLTWLAMKEEQ